MYKIYLIILLTFSFSNLSLAQNKKVRIKGDRTVKFYYEKDSSCIDSKKDNIKLIRTFSAFYKSIYNDDYKTFVSLLSPLTISKIDSSRIHRKFIRYKSYTANFFGKIQIEWIKTIPEKLSEIEQIYICIAKLPEGQFAKKRVGFDPAKRHKKDDTSFIGLMIVKIENEYKVVIPW